MRKGSGVDFETDTDHESQKGIVLRPDEYELRRYGNIIKETEVRVQVENGATARHKDNW